MSTNESSGHAAVSIGRNLFEYFFVKFNRIYEKFFTTIGTQIGSRPIVFIVLSFVLTAICSLGFLRLNVINDVDRLFIPNDSPSLYDRNLVAKLLPMDFNEYFIHQDYDLGRYGEVIFIAHDHQNIARAQIRKELNRIYQLILKINVTFENQTYFYEDVCAKRSGRCVVEGDIFFRESFWERLANKQFQHYVMKDFYTDDDAVPHSLSFIFGNAFQLNSSAGTFSTKVFKLHFNLRRNFRQTNESDFLSRLWEQAFLDFFHHLESIVVKALYGVSTSIDKELENNINLDIKLVFGTFATMIMVATFCLSLRAPFSESPVYLSAVGVFATLLGLISGFGFCSLIGVPICSLVFVTPFLIIGVGTDDMFLIYSAYRRTKTSDTTAGRMAETFRLCGSGISITSLTNVVAFLAGATTNFYGIRLFCFYTSASIAFCYIYQITLFGSSVAMHNECINRNRHTLSFCLLDRTNSSSDVRRRRRVERQCLPWQEMFMYIIRPLFTTTGQIIVCLIFVFYTIFAIYGATQMRDGMDFGQLLSDTSYARTYLTTLNSEFNIYPLVQLIITEPIPYWRTDYVRRIEELIKNLKKLDGMDRNVEISWLSMIGYNPYDYPFDNGTQFYNIANGFVNLFPTFTNDLVFNGTHITASRLYLQFARVCYNSSDGLLVDQLRTVVEQSKLPIIVYSSLFKYYEQMYEVIPNIIQTFLIAIEAMYLVTLLIIPDLKSVVITISTMCMILISLVAALHLWDIRASSVMMVELVMSVGFCSDFCVHIVHAFLTGSGTRRQRAQQALLHMGMPLLCASLSSVIGVMFLGFAQSYLFRTFFKTIVALMTLGTVHALLFLPVILSLIGSHWPSHMIDVNPSNEPMQMLPMTNSNRKSNGHVYEENTSKQFSSQNAPETINEEEDDELISTTTKCQKANVCV